MTEAKRRAQDALFTAIADQAENNMKSTLRAPEKAALLHELAEAYRLATASPRATERSQADASTFTDRVAACRA